jgi:hypothetical protein
MKRSSQFYAEAFRLGASRDSTTVIIGKHNDRNVFELAVENPFARNIEIIAVNKSRNHKAL